MRQKRAKQIRRTAEAATVGDDPQVTKRLHRYLKKLYKNGEIKF
jgi:hypothetical protein